MLRIATSVLLLACMHLSAGAPFHVMSRKAARRVSGCEALWCKYDIVTNQTDIILNTRREAEMASRITGDLLDGLTEPQFQIDGLKENGECKSIVLPTPPYSAFNSTQQSAANAFWNLTHLLQMYNKVWRLMELHDGYSEESELAKLDFYEIVLSRFSNQVERYLQVHRCSCKDTNCTLHKGINRASIQEVLQREFSPSGCSRKLLLGKIITRIQTEASSIYSILSQHDLPEIFTPWPVCATIRVNPINCTLGR